MHIPDPPESEHFRAGQAALHRGAWREARTCFEVLLRKEEMPEALEGFGMAAWGMSDTAATFSARERAYRLYRQRDDCRGAARMATHLAVDSLFFRGEDAIAIGWVQRARRLLNGVAPCRELGWLAVAEAQIVGWTNHDFPHVQALCAQAATLGRALGDIDLEMLALACKGLALVSQGAIDEGMRCLDEATLAAVAGEMRDIDAACTACCCLIFGCEWTRDYERAAQWIERLRGLSARWSHPSLFSFCRTHYAGLLIEQGAWTDAEAELEAAVTDLETTQPALAAEALVRLAGLRCRQGRLDAASKLLARAEAPPFRALAGDFCLLGRAALVFSRQDVETAIDFAERFLRAIPAADRMERFAGLELLLVLLVVHGDLVRAGAILSEIEGGAARVTTRPMQASARFAAGLVAAAMANYDRAKDCFEDAVDLWARSGAPYETALARLELAQILVALGRPESAAQQAQEAAAALQQLGAMPDAARATALLSELVTPPRPASGPRRAALDLTPRELEVLHLVAAGKSNQEIAQALVLSVRTVERHISNIYAKLGASGPTARATATAYALHRSVS